MIKLDWDNAKNELLKQTRELCFEDIENIVSEGGLLDVIPHFNVEKYPHQKILILNINDYIHYVSFVMKDDVLFLKNIIPSRKLNKIYNKKDK